jgi:hypothetical protein
MRSSRSRRSPVLDLLDLDVTIDQLIHVHDLEGPRESISPILGRLECGSGLTTTVPWISSSANEGIGSGGYVDSTGTTGWVAGTTSSSVVPADVGNFEPFVWDDGGDFDVGLAGVDPAVLEAGSGAGTTGGVQCGEKAPVAEPGLTKKRESYSNASNLSRQYVSYCPVWSDGAGPTCESLQRSRRRHPSSSRRHSTPPCLRAERPGAHAAVQSSGVHVATRAKAGAQGSTLYDERVSPPPSPSPYPTLADPPHRTLLAHLGRPVRRPVGTPTYRDHRRFPCTQSVGSCRAPAPPSSLSALVCIGRSGMHGRAAS